MAALIILVGISGGRVAGVPTVTADEHRIKAAFLRNFFHYVSWPPSVPEGEGAPWRVGVLGPDPFGEVLERTFSGRVEQGRGFEIVRADTVEKLGGCQLVYLALEDGRARRAALAALKARPVLTVGDAPRFLEEGGMIQFYVADRVGMGINLDQARAVALKIPSALLEVSRRVLEGGIVRDLR